MRIPHQNSRSATDPLASQYINKLDAFRTYSYYHVLGICNSQAVGNVKSVFEDPVAFKQAFSVPTAKDEFGYRKPVYIGDNTDVLNTYFVLCNGMTDIDIVVTELFTDMIVAMPKIQTGSKSLMGLNGEIVIKEPAGVKMLNMYRKISDTLKTNAPQLVLIIKTVFVGQRYDGSTEWLVDAPPIYGNIFDFKIAIDEQGSEYRIPFVNILGGQGLDPALTSTSNGHLIRGDGSIKSALDSLAASYTEAANANFKQLPPEIAKNKRPIEYEIRIHPKIQAQISGWTTTSQRNIRQASSNQGQPLIVPTNVSFEGAIEYMFESCVDYLQQSLSGSPNSFLYKILSVVEDTPSSSKSLYIITPTYPNKSKAVHSRLVAAADPLSELAFDDNVVIYDYIFTGKNTDITSFAMQIDEGLAYFSMITNVHTVNDEASKGNTVTTANTLSVHAANAPDGSPGQEKYALVGPATNSTEQQFASQGLTALKEQYNVLVDQTWSRGAAKVACVLQTRGHTGWLDLFAINPYKLAADPTEFEFGKIPDVYINIMMPQMDTSAASARDHPAKYERFWFKGLWHVVGVKNIFSDGLFSTELELIIIHPEPVKTVPQVRAVSGEPVQSSKDGDTTTPTTQPTGSSPTPAKPASVTAPGPATPAPNLPPAKPFVSNSTNGKHSLATTTNDTQLTKDFKLGNFTVTGTKLPNTPPTQDVLDNLVNLASVLQYIKDQLNIPITVSSGYRSLAVNNAVGGVAGSDHQYGMAVDFTSVARTPQQIVDAIIQLKVPYKKLILEIPAHPNGAPKGRGWVHLSVSPNKTQNVGTTLVWKGALSNNKYLPYRGTA